MAKVFGFTGEIGSGKTTAATLMHNFSTGESMHIEFSESVMDASNAFLRHIQSDLAHIDSPTLLHDILLSTFYDTFHISLDADKVAQFDYSPVSDFIKLNQRPIADTEIISQDNKEQFRPLLQWLGYEFTKKYHSDFWSRPIESVIRRESSQRDLITVGGVRYDANALMIRKLSGTVIKITGRRTPDIPESHSHISERGVQAELIDYIVENTGTLAQLAIKMHQLYRI